MGRMREKAGSVHSDDVVGCSHEEPGHGVRSEEGVVT